MLLFWPLIGALIGAYAAQKKGFSVVGGVIGGLLLGPLAFLLFFVSGLVSSNEAQRKCPFCAEWVKPEAVVCKHCGKELPPAVGATTRPGWSLLTKVVVGIGVAFVLFIGYVVTTGGPSATQPAAAIFGMPVTMAEFSQIKPGMSYEEVEAIIGSPGEEMSRSELAGFTTVMYVWKNATGSNMNAMFQNGALVNKAQFGLP